MLLDTEIVPAPASRFDRLKAVLACPECCCRLDYTEDHAQCPRCTQVYPIRNGKVYFIQPPERSDSLDDLKGKLKRLLGEFYHTVGCKVIAPTYPFDFRKAIRRFLDPGRQLVVDVGCGNYRLEPSIIGIDLFDYDAVDVVCDVTKSLPFAPGSVDAFVSRGLLEHVLDPVRTVRGMWRATRSGGMAIHLIPFLFPFHASPHDFQRYTHKGQEVLFAGYDVLEQQNATGPVTLLLLIAIEFLSILLSWGFPRVKAVVYLLLCALMFPFKYLDLLFVNRKSFLVLAPTIYSVLRKPEPLSVPPCSLEYAWQETSTEAEELP